MGESVEGCRRGSAQRCLPGMDEPEADEIIRESKRGRYSEHGNKQNFTDSLGRRRYSRDRLPQMHRTNQRHYSGGRLPHIRGTDSTDEEKHERHKRSSTCHKFSKGMFQRVSAVKCADRASAYNGGRLIKECSREMAYRRRDSDASFRQREPHYRRQVEGYSSIPKCLPHDQPDRRPCGKHSFDAGRGNFLSRNIPRSGDRTTLKEPHWSSRRKSNDDKFHMETSNSLSWNGPKWGEETTVENAPNSSTWMSDNNLPWNGPKWGEETIEDAPNSSKWRSDDVNPVCDKEAGNSLPWSGPKWGEETNPKANSSQWKSVADNQDYIGETNNGLPCTDSKQDDEAHTEDEPSSWRSTTTKWGSSQTKISSSWDDRATAKDVPSSLHWKSDADKWGSNMKTGRKSSWHSFDAGRDNFLARNSPSSGDRTTFKESHWSSRRKSNNDKFHRETSNSLSWNGPKWGEETTVEDAPNSSTWMSDNSLPWNGPKWGEETIDDAPNSSKWRSDDVNPVCDKEAGNSLPWSGPKWGEETSPKANSSQWKSVADNQDYIGETNNGLPCTDSKQDDEAHTEDEPSSWRSTTTKWRSSQTKISSSWDDRATAKDVPSSLHWKSDADKWGSNVKTGRKSSWHSFDAGRDNFLSRNRPSSGDRTTFKESHWSSRRKSNNDKFHRETSNSLSWNGPKWGEETTFEDAPNSSTWMSDNSLPWNGPKWGEETIEDAPNSSKWRSDDVNPVCDKEAGNSLPWSGPKWGEETSPKANSSQWKSVADNQDYIGETNNGLPCTDSKQDDEAHTEDEPSSWRSTTTKWRSSQTKISSSWDDRATAKDVPSSLHWKSDADKWGSNVKTGRKSSWHSFDAGRDNFLSRNRPSSGDRTTFKESHWSSRRKSNNDKFHRETSNSLSWNGPKWGEETTFEDAPNSSTWMSDNSLPWNGPKWGEETIEDAPNSSKWRSDDVNPVCDKEAGNSLPWSGPKWGEETSPKANSSQWKSVADNQDYIGETNNGLPCTDSKQDDEAHTEDEPSSWRSTTTKWRSSQTKISSSWDDRATAKDVPSSLHWKSDADKWGSNVKTGRKSSWHSFDAGRDNFLSRNRPSSGDRTTFKESHWSSRRKSNNDKFHRETSNSLSWNGPKWGEETTVEDAPNSSTWMSDNSLPWNGPKWGEEAIKDAPNSSKWRSDDVNPVCDKEAGNSLPWSGPKWGEETNPKANSSQWKSVADNQDYIGETNNGLPCTDSKPDDEAHTEDEPSSWRSTTTKWGSSQTKISSSWDDGATAKDVPSSLHWKSDADKWVSNVKTGRKSSWHGPEWGDGAKWFKPAPNSSQWKSVADNQGYNEKTDNGLSCTDSKRDDEVHSKDEPSSWRSTTPKWGSKETKNSSAWNDGATSKDVHGSLKWRSDTDTCGFDVKTGRKPSWHGPKWSDETDIKGTPSSRRSSNNQVTSKEPNSRFSRGPKWGGESTTKDAPSSYQQRLDSKTWCSNLNTDRKLSWHGPKWGADVKTNNSLSWHGPKWGDEPNTNDAPSSWRSLAECGSKESNNSSSLAGQKWDDKATQDAPASPKWKLDDDKWGSNAKLDQSSSWKVPEGVDKQTQYASSSGWKANANREISDVTAKWGYQTTTKSTPNSSSSRLNDDKQCNNVETHKSSWNGPKLDDHGTTEDASKSSRWGSNGDKQDSSVKTGGCSSLDSLKLGERSNTKDFPHSSQHQSDGDRNHYNMEANNRSDGDRNHYNMEANNRSGAVQGAYEIETCNKSSWSGQKWYDQTTLKVTHSVKRKLDDANNHCFEKTENSSLLKNPTWGDEITTKDGSSSCCKLDTDPQIPNIEANNSMLCNGPKQGQLPTKDALFASECSPKQVYNEESEKTYWNDSLWEVVGAKDAPGPFQHSSKDGKLEFHLNSGNSFTLDVPNVGVQIITHVSPNLSRQSLDNKMDHCVKVGSLSQNHLDCGDRTTTQSLSQNHLDCGDRTTTQEAYKRDFPSDNQNVTCETPGKDQHVLKRLQSPSSVFNLSDHKGLEGQSLNNGEQSQFASRREALNRQMEHSFSTNGQDVMPKLPSHGQGLKSDWHGHPVGSSRLSQPQENLKSSAIANEAYAASATVRIQPCSEYPSTEPFTIDSSNLKELAIQMKSQAAAKSLVSPSGAEGSSTIGDTNPRTNCDTRNAVEINKVDEKDMWLFKSAIAGFVKDIIKPCWKEGRLTKEAHKTIVKKVVDKVIDSMQVTDIPQTQKNIELYISYSKAKLTELVWAYHAKYAES